MAGSGDEAEVDLDAGGGGAGGTVVAELPTGPEALVTEFPYEVSIQVTHRPTGTVTNYHLFAEDFNASAIYENVEEPRDPVSRSFGSMARRKSARITLTRIAGEVTQEAI